MNLNYQFSNCLGAVYKSGNVAFTSKNNLLSPIGTRITSFDLTNHHINTFPTEHHADIKILAVSPDSSLILAIDELDRSLLINANRRIVLSQFNFKGSVRVAKFSPTGRYFIVAMDHQLQLWLSPGYQKKYSPFVLAATLSGPKNVITAINFDHAETLIVSATKDFLIFVHKCVESEKPQPPIVVLRAHRDALVHVFFSKDDQMLCSVSKDGAVAFWKRTVREDEELNGSYSEDEKENAKMPLLIEENESDLNAQKDVKRIYFKLTSKCFTWSATKSRISVADYCPSRFLLAVGFHAGIFAIFDISEPMTGLGEASKSIPLIQRMSMATSTKISSLALSSNGSWLALASKDRGQLIVWDWHSEHYVIRQQGHLSHANAIRSVAVSYDSRWVATGGSDAKIKIWGTRSGSVVTTFVDHESTVTGVAFSRRSNVLVSCSLDGTARAYDISRYVNFRVFTATPPAPFSAIAIDQSASIVAASDTLNFTITLFSLRTGKQIDLLTGNTSIVTGLAITGNLQVISCSMDGLVRVYDLNSNNTAVIDMPSKSSLTHLALRSDGMQVVVSSTGGSITAIDLDDLSIASTIDTRRDHANRYRVQSACHVTSLAYASDGQTVITVGHSPYACIYHIKRRMLLSKITLLHGVSGAKSITNTKNKKYNPKIDIQPFDLYQQKITLDIDDINPPQPFSCTAVVFTPNNRSFAVATTAGLYIYSLDQDERFDPSDQLSQSVTTQGVHDALKHQDLLKALIFSLTLQLPSLVELVINSTPPQYIRPLLKQLPSRLFKPLATFLGLQLDKSSKIEQYLVWIYQLLSTQGNHVMQNNQEMISTLHTLQKGLLSRFQEMKSICGLVKARVAYTKSERERNKQRIDAEQDLPQKPTLGEITTS